jgi:hypothetical protein
VLIYIERVQSAARCQRGKPAQVGVVVKRGCTLAPAVQIVTPCPRRSRSTATRTAPG